MTDDEKLEEISAVFTKLLITHKFKELAMYKELAKRLAVLVDAEIVWRMRRDNDLELMNFWPKEVLQ